MALARGSFVDGTHMSRARLTAHVDLFVKYGISMIAYTFAGGISHGKLPLAMHAGGRLYNKRRTCASLAQVFSCSRIAV
jgi:hypothetical protein